VFTTGRPMTLTGSQWSSDSANSCGGVFPTISPGSMLTFAGTLGSPIWENCRPTTVFLSIRSFGPKRGAFAPATERQFLLTKRMTPKLMSLDNWGLGMP